MSSSTTSQSPRAAPALLLALCLLLSPTVACSTTAAAATACAIDVDGATHRFENVYAIRKHDPYGADGGRLTSLVCTRRPVSDERLSDEGTFQEAFSAEGQEGFVAEVRDNGQVVTLVLFAGEERIVLNGPFGGFSEVHFEGVNGPDRIAGTLATREALIDDQSGTGTAIAFSLEVDEAVDATW